MAVTQKEIAEHLGISRSVVALALNGYGRVAEETRQRVKDAAQEMGYDARSNLAARSLIAKRHDRRAATGVLAVMTAKLNQGRTARDLPFYADLLDGIESEAGSLERDVVICSPRSERLPRFIEDRMVDGIIVFDADTLGLLKDVPLPVLLVSMPNPTVPFVAPAEKDGVYQATRHLLELGHRNIIFLGLNDIHATLNRAQGYRKAMEEWGLPHAIHESDGAPAAAAERMDALLQFRSKHLEQARKGGQTGTGTGTGGDTNDPTRCFTAVVARNDVIAMSAINKIREHGLRVPEDISVTGFDDVTPQYEFQPLVTSLKFDRFAMGKRAVELLCNGDLFEGDATARNKTVPGEFFDTELIVRESTAPPAAPGTMQ